MNQVEAIEVVKQAFDNGQINEAIYLGMLKKARGPALKIGQVNRNGTEIKTATGYIPVNGNEDKIRFASTGKPVKRQKSKLNVQQHVDSIIKDFKQRDMLSSMKAIVNHAEKSKAMPVIEGWVRGNMHQFEYDVEDVKPISEGVYDSLKEKSNVNKSLDALYDLLNKKRELKHELIKAIEQNPCIVKQEFKDDEIMKAHANALDKRKTQYADAIIYNHEGRILMLLRNAKDNKKELDNKWSLPGGHIDKDETPEEACKREVLEETNLVVETCTQRLQKITDNAVINFFSCHVDSDQLSLIIDALEHTNFKWVNKQELKELDTIYDLKETLNQIVFPELQPVVDVIIQKNGKDIVNTIDNAMNVIKKAFDEGMIDENKYLQALEKASKYGEGKKYEFVDVKRGGKTFKQRRLVGSDIKEKVKFQNDDDLDLTSNNLYRNSREDFLRVLLENNEVTSQHKKFISLSLDEISGGQDDFGNVKILFDFDMLRKQGAIEVDYEDHNFWDEFPDIAQHITGYRNEKEYNDAHDWKSGEEANEQAEADFYQQAENYENEKEVVIPKIKLEKNLLKHVQFEQQPNIKILQLLEAHNIDYKITEHVKKALETIKLAFDNNQVSEKQYLDALEKAKRIEKRIHTLKKTGKKYLQAHHVGSEEDIFYHGSASQDLKGGVNALHIGTLKAAKEALEATIGIKANGSEWDGTEEYGKVLLAGKKRIESNEFGKYRVTGFNCHIPEEDFYAKDLEDKYRASYSNGELIPLSVKPKIFKVRIKGEMKHLSSHDKYGEDNTDDRANILINKNKDNKKYGYFYKNKSEDSGSISAVVPNKDFLEIINDKQPSSILIQYLDQLSKLNVGEKQKQFFEWEKNNAKQVTLTPTDEIRKKYPKIDEYLKLYTPVIKGCYENSTKLAMNVYIPDVEIKYVEGMVSFSGVPIDHAWNKIGDEYFDITADIALVKKSEKRFSDEYLSIIELDSKEVTKYALETEMYGEYKVQKFQDDTRLEKAIKTYKLNEEKLWHGRKFKFNGKNWEHADNEKSSALKTEKQKQKIKIQDFTDEELETHANRSSLSDLQKIVKEGKHPKLREIAQRHLNTREASENEHSLYDLMVMEDSEDDYQYSDDDNTIFFDEDPGKEITDKFDRHGIKYLVNGKEVKKKSTNLIKARTAGALGKNPKYIRKEGNKYIYEEDNYLNFSNKTEKEVEDYFNRYNNSLLALTEIQRKALSEYKDDEYTTINAYLRKGERQRFKDYDENTKKLIDTIDGSFNQFSLKDNITIYRRVGNIFEKNNIFKTLKTDDVFSDKGFISTSLVVKEGEMASVDSKIDYWLEIRLRKHQHVIPMLNIGDEKLVSLRKEEYEILLPRSSRFKVIKKIGNKLIVEML